MRIETKIDLKKYILYSIPGIGFCFLLSKNFQEIIAITAMYIATIINQFILVELVSNMCRTEEGSVGKLKITTLFVGKFLVLIVGISLGVQLMGNRVIIPIMNYILLIFVLTFTVRKKVIG